MEHTHSATFHVPVRSAAFEAALEGLTRVNEDLMHGGGGPEGIGLPSLYDSNIRYRNEPRDVWRHAADVAREGWGDCEDLSAYRAAELRVSGEDPGAAVATYESGPHRYHAVVRRGDGSFEDPSRELGMGGPKMRKIRPHATVNVVGADPMPDDPHAISFQLVRVPGKGFGKGGGFRGFIRLPLGFSVPSSVTGAMQPQALVTLGPTKGTPEAAQAAAVKTAQAGANTVTKVLTNPLTQAALSQIPGGNLAASLLSTPQVQNGIKAAASALKFW